MPEISALSTTSVFVEQSLNLNSRTQQNIEPIQFLKRENALKVEIDNDSRVIQRNDSLNQIDLPTRISNRLNVTPQVLQNRQGGTTFDVLFPEETLQFQRNNSINFTKEDRFSFGNPATSNNQQLQSFNRNQNIPNSQSFSEIENGNDSRDSAFLPESTAQEFALGDIQNPLDNRSIIPNIVPQLNLQSVNQQSAQEFVDESNEERSFDEQITDNRIQNNRFQSNQIVESQQNTEEQESSFEDFQISIANDASNPAQTLSREVRESLVNSAGNQETTQSEIGSLRIVEQESSQKDSNQNVPIQILSDNKVINSELSDIDSEETEQDLNGENNPLEFNSGRFDPSPRDPSQLVTQNDPTFGVAVAPDSSLSDLTIASQSLVFDRNQIPKSNVVEPEPQELVRNKIAQEKADAPPEVFESKLISTMSK